MTPVVLELSMPSANQVLERHTDKEVNNNDKRALSFCDVEALNKCLKESNGDRKKCEEEIMAFQRSCSKSAPAKA